ncbi:hypothetical protein PV328_003095 [Microctonus aethiopoides]|uniref:Caspase-1 n=1 Tax=Microctonus aethiopoides TaxID=144406 RepID=A0AA39KKB0_9HYME|nr:hypothetical protein PV328_003095 [Microctonus aethiopoides]
MSKRKKCKEVFNQNIINDELFEQLMHSMEKRRRSVLRMDVIDSLGEGENVLPLDNYSTPQRTAQTSIDVEESPDENNSATSDPNMNIFKPEWTVREESDLLDAGLFNPESDDSTISVESISSPNCPMELNAPLVVEIDSGTYNMNHKQRGKCIIFNHEVFDTGFENRDGSTLDAKRIESTFKNLGFTVEICINLKHCEVLNKINELSAENHDDNDCICIFILTHGLAPDMIFAKDVAFRLDNIWKPFTADKCTSLAGKPKLFFFQACRGEEFDNGIQLRRGITSSRSETDNVVTSYKLPTYADFLIAHSTVQGFYSWRNPEEGTWFVQCLCDVLDEYHETTDLLKMLTICARKVATQYSSYNDVNPEINDKKQVPSITSMLIRDLYFSPK